MTKLELRAATVATCMANEPGFAGEVQVTWLDPSCGTFVVKLTDSDQPEKFGLFSARQLPMPNVGDAVQGRMTEVETQLANPTSGETHMVIHWTDTKLQEQLVRNTPVRCASKWQNREKC